MPSKLPKRANRRLKEQRQGEDFVRAAKELGGDESRERFDSALRVIGKQKPKDEPEVELAKLQKLIGKRQPNSRVKRSEK